MVEITITWKSTTDGVQKDYQTGDTLSAITDIAGQPNWLATLDGSWKVPIGEIPSTIVWGVDYQWTWNANTNTPTLTSWVGTKWDYYVVNIDGTTNLDGITDWKVWDYAIFNGTIWEKIDNTDAVSSVFGRIWTVIATNWDYTALQVTNTPAGWISATTVQTAIEELDTEKAKIGANSDITSLSGITDKIQTPTYIDFDETVAKPAHQEWRVFYDNWQHTLAYYNDEADVTHNIWAENWIRVRNSTGSTIVDWSVVYISWATGQIPNIILADADSEPLSRAIWVVTHDIENNTNWYVTAFGLVNNINTSAFNDGDVVYVSSTAWAFTATPPTAPSFRIFVWVVVYSHITNGKLLVKPSTTGMIGYGGANQVLGMNSGATWQEYKNIVWTTNEVDISPTANQIQIGLPDTATSYLKTRIHTAVWAVTVTDSDYIVIVNKTSWAATTVNLPVWTTNKSFIIKDWKWDANTNNITIDWNWAENIDWTTTSIINTNYWALTIVWNWTQWNAI